MRDLNPHPSLPHSEDAEKALLCSIILNPIEAIGVVRNYLSTQSFYIPANQLIYGLLLEFHDKGKLIDFTLLKEELRRLSQLDEIGGVEYLNHLWNFVPAACGVNHYADIVRQNELRRSAIFGAQQVISLAYEANTDFSCVRDQIEQILTSISRQITAPEQSLREITLQWHDALSTRAERLKHDGFRFGIPLVDDALGPIRPGDYVVISAETSGGKSLFAFQGALHAAMHGLPVAAFSLEMSDEQLLDRLFSHMCTIPMNSFRRGQFLADELKRLNKQIPRFVDLPLHLGQARDNDIGSIASKLRRLKAKHGIKVALVDYLQRVLPSTHRKDGTRYLEVAEVSDRLKSLALELELVMLAPCQLNRDGYTRQAASIEHDADVHIKLVQPDENEPTEIELRVEKNRQGPRYLSVELELAGEFMTLRERTRKIDNSRSPIAEEK